MLHFHQAFFSGTAPSSSSARLGVQRVVARGLPCSRSRDIRGGLSHLNARNQIALYGDKYIRRGCSFPGGRTAVGAAPAGR